MTETFPDILNASKRSVILSEGVVVKRTSTAVPSICPSGLLLCGSQSEAAGGGSYLDSIG